MVKRLKKSMQKKGWTQDELLHLEKTLKTQKMRDYKTKKSLSGIFFSMLLLTLFILNFFGMIIISPFLLILDGIWIYLVSGVFALLFGVIVSSMVSHFKTTNLNHRLAFSLAFFGFLGLDIYIFPKYLDFLGGVMRLNSSFGYLEFSIFFVVMLVIPYFITHQIIPRFFGSKR